MSKKADERPGCRLYLITPDNIPDLKAFARLRDETLSAGDVACLELPHKGATEDVVAAAVQTARLFAMELKSMQVPPAF